MKPMLKTLIAHALALQESEDLLRSCVSEFRLTLKVPDLASDAWDRAFVAWRQEVLGRQSN